MVRTTLLVMVLLALGTAAACGAGRVGGPGSTTTAGEVRLPLPFHSQLGETDGERWNPRTTCGPTALLMVLHQLGLEEDLATVIERTATIPARSGGYDPSCSAEGNPVCTSPGALEVVARDEYGLAVEARDGWTLDDVRAALARGRPVIADVNVDLDPRNPGHFVVIIGHSSHEDVIRLRYHDPYREADMVASWADFARSWQGPIDRGDPLQPEGHRFWGMTVTTTGNAVGEGPDPCDWEQGGRLGLPRCPNTGDPLPDPPVTDPDCQDRAAGATRWLASDPHTPLAITDPDNGIVRAGHHCCAPWARRGAGYRAIDAWGQVVGTAEVVGGEGYDVTRCFELSLRVVSGLDGVGIYVSSEGGWQPPRSAEWQPAPAEREAHARFVAAVEQVAVQPPIGGPRFEDDDPVPPLPERILFFQFETDSADGRERVMHHYGVSGGRILLIAWQSPGGWWILAHLENDLTNNDLSPAYSYRPIAVADMDANGSPEVVYHWTEGPSWGQVVLQLETVRGSWTVAAESIGGATL